MKHVLLIIDIQGALRLSQDEEIRQKIASINSFYRGDLYE